MSKSINDTLRELHDSGYSLVNLLKALDIQLELIRQSDLVKSSGDKGRLFSLARTNIETGCLYAEKFEQQTDCSIPLMFVEGDD